MHINKYFKVILLTMIVIIPIILLVYNYNISSKENQENITSVNDSIKHSLCAKFEYANSDDEPLFVWDPLLPLTSLSPYLIVNDEFDEDYSNLNWSYKITFWCHEVTPENQEVVVLVYDNFLIINGTCYITPKDIPFSEVIDDFKNKYDYYKENYVNKLNNPSTRREPD